MGAYFAELALKGRQNFDLIKKIKQKIQNLKTELLI